MLSTKAGSEIYEAMNDFPLFRLMLVLQSTKKNKKMFGHKKNTEMMFGIHEGLQVLVVAIIC